MAAADVLPPGVRRVRAPNPSPLTLDGTNTYIAEGWVVDPGPDHAGHLDAVMAAAGGSIEGIVLTHGHPDHAAGAPALAARAGDVPVLRPAGDGSAGPFRAIATPGHAPDHVVLLLGAIAFTGDTVLGAGSVFVGAGEGSMAAYLRSLRRLRALRLDVLLPGHGPVVADPVAKLDEYLAHRLEREQRVLDALGAGVCTREGLLDAAWDDVPAGLRPAAAMTLEAHLEKLRDEGSLPPRMP